MKEYLELASGSSSKFWQVEVSGSKQTVTYGKIGSKGLTKVKTFKTKADAIAASEKLADSKIKKGYINSTKSSKKSSKQTAAKSKAKKTSSPTKANSKKKTEPNLKQPELIIDDSKKYLFYRNKTDIWVYLIDSQEYDELSRGVSLLDYESVYDRFYKNETCILKFSSETEAIDALRTFKAKCKGPYTPRCVSKLPFDATRDLNKPDVKLPFCQQRIGTFEIAVNGPISVCQSPSSPDWIYPRPPTQCLLCNGPMLPAVSIRGPIYKPLGNNTGLYLFVCGDCFPTSTECSGSFEFIVQDGARVSDNSIYLQNGHRKEFCNLHLTIQTNESGQQLFGLVEHRGEKGIPGSVIQFPYKNKKQARDAFEKREKFLRFKLGFKDNKSPKMETKQQELNAELFQSRRRLVGDPPKPLVEKKFKLKRTVAPYQRFSGSAKHMDYLHFKPMQGVLGGESSTFRVSNKELANKLFLCELEPDAIYSKTLARGHDGVFRLYVDPESLEARLLPAYD